MSGNGENGCGGVVDFYVLPEGCIANALSLTSPRHVCRLSLVASIFRSAAESDDVWKRFLPPDYEDIVARSVDRSALTFASKKELYLHLCDHPLIIEGGTKSFSLQKWSGKRCYMLAARDLSIVWGNTPRYWRWTSFPESRFSEVAELIGVSWLEIRGKINTSMLSPNTTYAAYLVFKTTAGAYGFDYHPAEVSVGINGGGGETQTVYLDPDGGQRLGTVSRENGGQYPKLRGDGWMEIELGQYVNKGGQDGEMEMSLMEVKQYNWKSGLIIQGLDIRPKED